MPRIQRLLIPVAALALLLVGGLTGAIAQSGISAEPNAAAVVDVRRLLSELKQRQELDAGLQQKVQAFQNTVDERRRELAGLKQELDMLAEGQPEHTQGMEELQLKQLEFQAWQQFQQQKLQREQVRLQEQLYSKAMEGVGAVAQRMGFDMVLFKEGEIGFDQSQPQAAIAQISLRKVLWASDRIDITNAVLDHLNR